MLLLNNMEKAGFIKVQGQYSKIYSTLRKNLNLLVEDINEQVHSAAVNSISYFVYSIVPLLAVTSFFAGAYCLPLLALWGLDIEVI